MQKDASHSITVPFRSAWLRCGRPSRKAAWKLCTRRVSDELRWSWRINVSQCGQFTNDFFSADLSSLLSCSTVIRDCQVQRQRLKRVDLWHDLSGMSRRKIKHNLTKGSKTTTQTQLRIAQGCISLQVGHADQESSRKPPKPSYLSDNEKGDSKVILKRFKMFQKSLLRWNRIATRHCSIFWYQAQGTWIVS